MIRNAARAYSQDKLMPRITKAIWKGRVHRDIFRDMGELGLIDVTLPEEYGCANASYVAYGLVAREIERVDSGCRSMKSVHSWLVMHPIYGKHPLEAAGEPTCVRPTDRRGIRR